MPGYYRALLLGLLVLLLPTRAQAQLEGINWYFGQGAGVRLGGPVGAAPGALTDAAAGFRAREGSSSFSSPTGQLLLYSNGEQVWDASHQVMPNGSNLLGCESSTQGALLVRQPGSSSRYFLFTTDCVEHSYREGLRYSVVDMSLRGGLGDVLPTAKAVRLPIPTATAQVEEKLAAALHANGQDIWIVVHGWNNDEFYSFRLSATGVDPQPVVSQLGSVHRNLGAGYLRLSNAGLGRLPLLATTNYSLGNVELFDFDPATGAVLNFRDLSFPLSPIFAPTYGLEFSPDASRLYCTGTSIFQFDLQAGSLAAIRNSRLELTQLATGGIQLGPDGKIYLPQFNQSYLAVIEAPNALGMACNLQLRAVPLGGRLAQRGLPNLPPFYTPTVQVRAPSACAGQPAQFASLTTPVAAPVTISWNFGDPASGSNNTATGPAPTHSYATAGTYTVVASAQWPGAPFTAQTSYSITVNPSPTAELGAPRQDLCPGQALTLTPGAQPPGSTYRWQDGSTAASFTARLPGRYAVTVTGAGGCSATDSVLVVALPAPLVRLPADTTACLAQPLRLRLSAQPAGSTYRWQDGSTAEVYAATVPGTYSVDVTGPNGCVARVSTVVRAADCPLFIPSIITPNGDGLNDAFVLKGAVPAEWQLEIYNRWGRLVYRSARYENRWQAAQQPDGVYYYLLRRRSDGRQIKGWVEVVH
jgi:gliding motility-associated-like protein